ncbi:MAG: alanine racemase, partial [Magnetococcales bacterium]|nr:alanine racemase [Magnetococcales bacterium]
MRPTWLEIDLAAVVHNFRLARQRVGAGVAVYPAIKADGYGLGAVAIARTLSQAGADGFCVALIEEAQALLAAGITQPIILLSGLTAGMEQLVIQLGLQPLLHSRDQALRLAASLTPGQQVVAYLKVDSGMGRLGISPERVPTLLRELSSYPGLQLAGLVSHFACADEPEHPENARQLVRMQQLLAALPPTTSGRPWQISMANSAAVLAHPASHYHWVRPGILLYGASPFFPQRSWRDEGLRPVVHWISHIIQLADLPAQHPFGYGHGTTTQRPSRLAQVAVGYGDGYRRCLGNRAQAVVRGERVPVVGRVCMDLITLDVTD